MSNGFSSFPDDRVASFSLNESPLTQTSTKSESFWDRYFELRNLASQVADSGGAFNIEVVNHATGESVQMQNIRLKGFEDDEISN